MIMKKSMCCFVLVVLVFSLLSGLAIAEGNAFTLRKGIMFGMSVQEVISAEKEAGIEMQSGSVSMGNAENGHSLEELWCERRTFAGIDDTMLQYYFFEGAVFQMHYRFPNAYKSTNDKVIADFTSVSSSLNNKYGTSEYSTLTGKRITLPTIYNKLITSGFGEHDLQKEPDRLWRNDDYQVDQYEEWLIEQEDGTAVFIHHCVSHNASDGPDGYKSHYLFYTLYDAETVAEYRQKTDSAADDL